MHGIHERQPTVPGPRVPSGRGRSTDVTRPVPTSAVGTHTAARRSLCRMRSFARLLTSTLLVAAIAVAVAVVPANAVQSFQDRVVVADPADWTPNVLDGRVNAIVVVGTTAIAGGTFSQVQAPGGAVLTRSRLVAFDAATGAIDPGFTPGVNGKVLAAVAVVPGLALAFGGIRRLGGALTPYPKPVEGAEMTQTGVYALVRHPIYGGTLVLCLAAALWTSPWALVPTAALGVLFEQKSRREEVWLVQAHPGYEEYRARVRRRFVPFVW